MDDTFKIKIIEQLCIYDDNNNALGFCYVCQSTQPEDFFLWLKNTRYGFDVLKERLREMIEHHHNHQIISIFRRPPASGSPGKHFPFTIKKESQESISNLQKYRNGNYDSLFIYLPNFNLETIKSIAYSNLIDDSINTAMEGENKELNGTKKSRCSKIAKKAKIRDGYKCQSCEFYFENKIVEAHHLDPLYTFEDSKPVSPDDLITLCPNCHRIAHVLIKKDRPNDTLDAAQLIRKIQNQIKEKNIYKKCIENQST